MFFQKKKVVEEELIDVSGEIERISSYTPFNSANLLVFTIKDNSNIFFLKYANVKNVLSQKGDSVSFKVEKSMQVNSLHGEYMIEVQIDSFKNNDFM